jgi:hypothetical protein
MSRIPLEKHLSHELMAIVNCSILRLNDNTTKPSFIGPAFYPIDKANMTGMSFIGIRENGIKSATHRKIEEAQLSSL